VLQENSTRCHSCYTMRHYIYSYRPLQISKCFCHMILLHDTFVEPKEHCPSPVPNSRHRLSTRRHLNHRKDYHFRPAPISYDYVEVLHGRSGASRVPPPWPDARRRCGWEISHPSHSARLDTAFAHMERQQPSAAPGRREYLSASRRTSRRCRPATMLASCVRPQAPSLHRRRYSATYHAPPIGNAPRKNYAPL
jgi:hypothetical protein